MAASRREKTREIVIAIDPATPDSEPKENASSTNCLQRNFRCHTSQRTDSLAPRRQKTSNPTTHLRLEGHNVIKQTISNSFTSRFSLHLGPHANVIHHFTFTRSFRTPRSLFLRKSRPTLPPVVCSFFCENAGFRQANFFNSVLFPTPRV